MVGTTNNNNKKQLFEVGYPLTFNAENVVKSSVSLQLEL